MPRSRGGSSEMIPSSTPAPATQSPRRRVPLNLKSTAASEANSLLHGRSPRSAPLPDMKKRATAAARAADLEAKLAQAMEELNSLKDQLAKRDAEQPLEAAKTHIPTPPPPPPPPPPAAPQIPDTPPPPPLSEPPATDVFEVVPPAVTPTEPEQGSDGDKAPPKTAEEAVVEVEPPESAEMAEQLTQLRANLAEKERELELCVAENEGLKKRAADAEAAAAAAKEREGELVKKLVRAGEEVAERSAAAEKLRAEVEAAEMGRMAVDAEMGRVKAQAEQWRKAAEAAAAVLADEGEGGGRRVAERCGSMGNGFGGVVWSPVMGGEADEECGAGGGGGRRKGGGIRIFGDLWKKKGQQQQHKY